MKGDLGDVLRLAAAAVTTVAVVRFTYTWFFKSRDGATDPHKVKAIKEETRATTPVASADAHEKTVFIYFGSQSGTAEAFAKELEEDACARDIKATVIDMGDFDPDEFVKHKIVVLTVATYGEGDPTDNAVDFFQWLKDESLPSDTLAGMRFTVMGLGNRQYVNFNSCGKQADEYMERLGAIRIHERGEGDDDQNIEEDLEQWKEGGLWPALQKALGIETEAEEAAHTGLETPDAILSKLSLRAEVGADANALPVDPLVQVGGADILGKWYFNASQASVVRCDELRQVSDANNGKTTKHLDFDIKHLPAFEWKTADNLEVLPSNPDETIEWFASRLGMEGRLDSTVTFVRAEGIDKVVKKPFPSPCPVRSALGIYCDLGFAPSRNAAKRIAALAEDNEDRDALDKLLQDREAYHWLTGDGVRLSLQEFFELYMGSAKVELGAFLQLCPRQKSRPYTIASSFREDSKRIGVCVSMVQESLCTAQEVINGLKERGHVVPRAEAYLQSLGEAGVKQRRTFRGSCSTALCTRTAVGDKFWVYSRPSSFRLPKRTTTPIIMIGAGTGIAPFRGFLREFKSEGGIRTKTMLFFGCTKSDVDFVYREELEQEVGKSLGELITAFSREQDHKVYVQHRLKEREEQLREWVRGGAYVYVCGAVAMGAAVREELGRALGSSDQVSKLQTEGRLVEELW